MKKINPFIGYNNLALPVTFAAVLSNIIGVGFALRGRVGIGMVCLVIAGICDLFDGPIARRQKERNVDQIRYGIELDSLADVVNFGFVPALLLYANGMREWYFVPLYLFFIAAGIVRLAYFNVLAFHKAEEGKASTSFVGLPITSASGVLPVAWIISERMSSQGGNIFLSVIMLLSGLLFISSFKFPKIPKKYYWLVVLLAAGLIALIVAHFLNKPMVP